MKRAFMSQFSSVTEYLFWQHLKALGATASFRNYQGLFTKYTLLTTKILSDLSLEERLVSRESPVVTWSL